ncbi:MAG: ribose-phosphate diphosphokinase [Methanothrix sp.]
MIVAGVTADYGIGRGVAERLGSDYCRFFSKVFPDGESYIRLDREVKGEDILLVQSMDSDQDKRLFEMLMAADSAMNSGADNIYGLITYMAYARQDRAFGPGEPISARVALKALYGAGVSKLAVIEPHKNEELSYFKGKSIAIEVLESIAREAVMKTGAVKLIAPDYGSSERVKKIAYDLGLEWDYIEKKRNRDDGSLSMGKGLERMDGIKGLVLDDMISTGGTAALAVGDAIAKGAASVSVAAAHMLLVGGAYERIKSAGANSIFGSNSTRNKSFEVVDVSKETADALSKLVGD